VRTQQAVEQDYVGLRRKVTGFLAGRYPQLDADAREDIYQDAWVALLEALRRGEVARAKWISYLLSTAKNLGAEALRCADRRRRVDWDPIGERGVPVADAAETPEERVVSLDTGRELLGRLSAGERDVAAYRLFFQFDKYEVCRALGLSTRAYKRRVDRAAVKVRELRADHAGGVTERQRLMLARCLRGRATPAQRTEVRRLLKTAAGRAAVAELRRETLVAGRRPSPPACSRQASGGSSPRTGPKANSHPWRRTADRAGAAP
jgi:DNA-directed RNA polymerase specialized sigma24 family protein